MRHLYSIKNVFIIISLLFITACTDSSTNQQTQLLLQGKTMGTTYSVKFFASDKQTMTESYYQDIDLILEQVNDQMSTYRANSELSLFNQHRELTPYKVSADTAFVVESAIKIGQETQGALDVTLGPIINLWGFGANGIVTTAPSDELIKKTQIMTGLDKLNVNKQSLTKTIPELYVDLSAIAKGYGVDKIAEYLDSKGINSYLVEVGGEMRAKGIKPNGDKWRIAIEKPEPGERVAPQFVFNLNNIAIATSGDYRNYFEDKGVRYSHTIDPITAKPITHNLASVTVLHKSSMFADGYATALNVMGPEKALKFAEEHKLAVYLVIKSDSGFEVKHSQAFSQLID